MSKYIVDTEDYLFDLKGIIGVGLDRNKQIVFRGTPIEEMEQLNESYVRKHFEDELESAFAHGRTEAESEYRDLLDKAKDEAYQRGLDDAWEAVRKILMLESDGGYSWKEMKSIFGTDSASEIYVHHTAAEAINKIKAYEEKQNDEIEVGDTVDLKDAVSDKGDGIVTKIVNNDYCYIVWYDGSGGAWAKDMLFKTGKHIDIASILEDMRND